MKTRNGFVSNSSSSSFVLAVPAGIVQETLDILTITMSEANWEEFYPKSFSGGLEEYKEILADEIEAAGQDVVWADEKLKQLKCLYEDLRICAAISVWDSLSNPRLRARRVREMEEYREEHDLPPISPVEIIMHRVKDQKKKAQSTTARLSTRLSKITEAQEGGATVYVFEDVDYMAKEFRILETLIEKGALTVLERTNT